MLFILFAEFNSLIFVAQFLAGLLFFLAGLNFPRNQPSVPQRPYHWSDESINVADLARYMARNCYSIEQIADMIESPVRYDHLWNACHNFMDKRADD